MLGLDYLHTKCKVIHTDIKPENILVCITEEEIQQLAVEATAASQQGKLTKSLTATAPKHVLQKQTDSSAKMSKNKKKKMKQKLKKQLQKHQQEIDENECSTENTPQSQEEGAEQCTNTPTASTSVETLGNTEQCVVEETEENTSETVNGMDVSANKSLSNKDLTPLSGDGTTSDNGPISLDEPMELQSGNTVTKTNIENSDLSSNDFSNNNREQPVALNCVGNREQKTTGLDPILTCNNINNDIRMVSVDRDPLVNQTDSPVENSVNEERSRDEERKDRFSPVKPSSFALEDGI